MMALGLMAAIAVVAMASLAKAQGTGEPPAYVPPKAGSAAPPAGGNSDGKAAPGGTGEADGALGDRAPSPARPRGCPYRDRPLNLLV